MKESKIKLQLIPYSKKYLKLFKQYKEKILHVLNNFDLEVYHIGSTAIPNLLTKGDLDVLVLVKQNDFIKVCNKLLELYKQDEDNKPTETYMGFKDQNNQIPVGIQVVVTRSKEEEYFLTIKNILLTNPKYQKEYNQLKQKFAGRSLEEYRKEKDNFITKILKSI